MKYIYLSGPVDYYGINSQSVRAELDRVRADDPAAPVTVVLNSMGGDVIEGIAVYNLLRAAGVDVIVSGMAASIASVIACAGRRVSMYANSLLFIHHAWSFGEGRSDQLRQQADQLEEADRILLASYAAKTGRSEDDLRGLLDGPAGEGTSLTAEKALELGFIDEILDPAQAVAACLKSAHSHPINTNKPKEEPPMAAEPTTTTPVEAECGQDPKNEEEIVEVEKKIEKTDDEDTRLTELEKKIEELTAKLEAASAKLTAQKKFRAVTAAAAVTAEEQRITWAEAVAKHGFAKAAELFPTLREEHMKAEFRKGSIR